MDHPALAPVLEVFASIQGEGRYVGEPQVFLRLRGCPMRCTWCDTPGSWDVPAAASARVMTPDGPERHPLWASPFHAITWIGSAEPRDPRTVSLTGGEPLIWPEFILGLRTMLGGRRLHLETAGGHPEALARVIDVIDHVSLDLKLPADLEAPVPSIFEGPDGVRSTSETAPNDLATWRIARRRCLTLVSGRDACAKIVVSGERSRDDYQELLEDVSGLAAATPVVLQPVTPLGGATAPSAELLNDLAEDARDLGLEVRVVPQVHRTLGIA